MLVTLHHAELMGLGLDEVDLLTGPIDWPAKISNLSNYGCRWSRHYAACCKYDERAIAKRSLACAFQIAAMANESH